MPNDARLAEIGKLAHAWYLNPQGEAETQAIRALPVREKGFAREAMMQLAYDDALQREAEKMDEAAAIGATYERQEPEVIGPITYMRRNLGNPQPDINNKENRALTIAMEAWYGDQALKTTQDVYSSLQRATNAGDKRAESKNPKIRESKRNVSVDGLLKSFNFSTPDGDFEVHKAAIDAYDDVVHDMDRNGKLLLDNKGQSRQDIPNNARRFLISDIEPYILTDQVRDELAKRIPSELSPEQKEQTFQYLQTDHCRRVFSEKVFGENATKLAIEAHNTYSDLRIEEKDVASSILKRMNIYSGSPRTLNGCRAALEFLYGEHADDELYRLCAGFSPDRGQQAFSLFYPTFDISKDGELEKKPLSETPRLKRR